MRQRLRARLVQMLQRSRPRLEQATRGALAAVAAYLVALAVLSGPPPLVAPLTALLVVEVTLFSTLQLGLLRVSSVVAGVLLAVGFSGLVGFSWWSLGLLLLVSLFIGSLLRLGSNATEVPISGMLVLAVGGEESVATDRIVETLIGAGIGILVNGLAASEVRIEPAGAAVDDVARDLGDLLDRIATELRPGNLQERARRWLEEARRIDSRILEADRELVQAEQSRWLNPRARKAGHSTPALRTALDALERAAVSVRSATRSLLDLLDEQTSEESLHSRRALAGLLQALATLVRNFGEAAHDEAHIAAPLTESRLVANVEEARRRRDRVAELLLSETAATPQLWQVYGALLTHIDRVIADLDPQERARARREWQQIRQVRLPPSAAEAADAMGRFGRSAPRRVARLSRETPRRVRRLRLLRPLRRRRKPDAD